MSTQNIYISQKYKKIKIMDFKTLLDNTIPNSLDSKIKILNNIKLLNHYLTDTINRLNDLKKHKPQC